MSDMSSTSGYMGEKYFQEFGPICFDKSSASGYMGEKYFQEIGPRSFDMILSHGAPSSLNMSSYRAISTPFQIQVHDFHKLNSSNTQFKLLASGIGSR